MTEAFPDPSKPWSVRARHQTQSSRDIEQGFGSFDELLDFCRQLDQDKFPDVMTWNSDRCDYADDTGWDDGLTDDQREQLEDVLVRPGKPDFEELD